MAQNTYHVEYSSTNRATCKNKKCGKKIEKEVLRIGKRFPSARFTDDGEATDWFHWNCIFDQLSRARKTTKRIESTDDLIGFSGLADAEQALIKKAIKGDFPPPGNSDGSGGGGGGGGSDTEPKAKPKKATKSKKGGKLEAFITSSSTEIGPLTGTIFLGRGDESKIHDKKVSKKQVEIKVGENSIEIIPRGVNPIFIMKKGEKIIMAEKGESHTLTDGDSFNLLMDKYPFNLHMRKATKAKKKEKEGAVISLTGKKRSASSEEEDNLPNEYDLHDSFIDNRPMKEDIPDLEDEDKPYHSGSEVDKAPVDEDLDEVLKEGKKFVQSFKRRAEEASMSDGEEVEYKDGKPICKYGEGCYRKNPQHREEFWHPNSKKIKTEGSSFGGSQKETVNDEMKSKLEEIKGVFGDKDDKTLLAALKKTGGDVEKAVEILLGE